MTWIHDVVNTLLHWVQQLGEWGDNARAHD